LGTIKNWETQHFSALDKQNKGMYQMGLNRKLSRLEEEFERQPSTIKGIDKAKNL
jgi:phage portal protein BeeE